MSCKEPGAVVDHTPLGAKDPDSNTGGSALKRRSKTDNIDSQSIHSVSISTGTRDDANVDDTFKHDSARRSYNKSDELMSPKQDESGDEDAMSSSSSSSSEDEELSTWLKQQPKKVNVKWSDYEAFKNRFSPEEGHDIIEVLEGHPDQLRTELLHERSKRRHKKHSRSRSKRQAENDSKFIHRIRIQSSALLFVLGRLTGQDDWHEDEPLIFLRPFQTLYYSFPFRSEGVSSIETDDPLQKLSMPSDMDLEDIIYGLLDFKSEGENTLTVMEHIKLYVEFVKNHIVPIWDEARGSSKHKVRFSDLPMNKTGKAGSDTTRNEGLAVHQNYWKLCYAQFQEPAPRPGDKKKERHIGMRMLSHNFVVYSFHVDFDGDEYGPMPCEMIIFNYEGEVDIRSLTVYPLRFDPDAAQKTKELAARAKNFLSYVRERHLSYDGWTLIHGTYARRISEEQKRMRVEHIEGEVMIDFKEGFQMVERYVD
ncbi:putative aaa family [Diaporthe ampelina]|uniref:Putative aaa family n=1 Tax=Diaporthe ampelina TaxID=1214573 RepID=A0A0G2H9U2_9PEZI|nr:putative aaa family [Diaporthe ampelina]